MAIFVEVGGLSDHWPDVAMATLIAILGYLLRRDISTMDKRHERAEEKFEKQDGRLEDHEVRITVLEKDRK